MITKILVILLILAGSEAFRSSFIRSRSCSLSMRAISPRKALFFEIVETGLKERYENEEASRIFKFCQYAKNELDSPVSIVKGHEPCEEYIDKLTPQPWWPHEQFDWVDSLNEQSPKIRNELEAVLAAEAEQTFKGDSRYQETMGLGWTAFRLQRLGEWNEENMAKFPITTSIIKSLNIPLAVRGVMFAKQAPGTGVQPHSDGRNFILTAHLGLKVPKQQSNDDNNDQCWIEVAGKRRGWEEDKTIVFDTSFTHCTANDSNDDRYVLIIDFWHPELTSTEQKALEYIYDCRNKFETGKAASIDSPYIINGGTLDEEEFVKSKKSFGEDFINFWKDGGLVKFNPMQKR